MWILGLLLIAAGSLAIVTALFGSEGTAQLLGTDLSAMTIFFIGVGAGAAILWGLSLTKFGAKRSLRQRREGRKLTELSEKLDRADDDRQHDNDGDGDRDQRTAF